MGMDTPKLIILVFLINLMLAQVPLMMAVDASQTDIANTMVLQSAGITTDVNTLQTNMQGVDSNGAYNLEYLLRKTGTTFGDAGEAQLSLGNGFAVFIGLLFSVALPQIGWIPLGLGLLSADLLTGFGYFMLGLISLMINMVLYKRFWDIAYAKYQG